MIARDVQGPIYYRDAHAALLVFDITDTDSFKRVKRWVDELHAMVSPSPVCLIATSGKHTCTAQQKLYAVHA